MAIRFTDTDKWGDAWFSSLSAKSKLLFLFLCDNCNIAGIIEINKPIWSAHTSLSTNEINKCLVEIEKCYILSNDKECLFIRNFLKHQKNLPINENNRSHVKILSIYDNYKHKFDNQDIEALIQLKELRGIEGGSKGDASPTGNSNSNSNSSSIKGGLGGKEKERTEEEKSFDRFNDWIDKNIPYLRKIRDQITFDEYQRLTEKYSGKQMRKVLTDMANYKDAPKRYVSVNLTFQNWAKKEYGG